MQVIAIISIKHKWFSFYLRYKNNKYVHLTHKIIILCQFIIIF